MFAPEVHDWLVSASTPEYQKHITESKADRSATLKKLGLSENSEIFHFYTVYGEYTYRGWYELHSPNELFEYKNDIRAHPKTYCQIYS